MAAVSFFSPIRVDLDTVVSLAPSFSEAIWSSPLRSFEWSQSGRVIHPITLVPNWGRRIICAAFLLILFVAKKRFGWVGLGITLAASITPKLVNRFAGLEFEKRWGRWMDVQALADRVEDPEKRSALLGEFWYFGSTHGFIFPPPTPFLYAVDSAAMGRLENLRELSDEEADLVRYMLFWTHLKKDNVEDVFDSFSALNSTIYYEDAFLALYPKRICSTEDMEGTLELVRALLERGDIGLNEALELCGAIEDEEEKLEALLYVGGAFEEYEEGLSQAFEYGSNNPIQATLYETFLEVSKNVEITEVLFQNVAEDQKDDARAAKIHFLLEMYQKTDKGQSIEQAQEVRDEITDPNCIGDVNLYFYAVEEEISLKDLFVT